MKHLGDQGLTKVLGYEQLLLKNNPISEAQGSIDELQANIGLLNAELIEGDDLGIKSSLKLIMKDLLSLEGSITGGQFIPKMTVEDMDVLIDKVDSEVPFSFRIPVEDYVNIYANICRVVTRRVERRIISAFEWNHKGTKDVLTWINRLSTYFYAIAVYYES